MFDVVILTKDSHRTIDLIILYLRHLGLDPLILLDAESNTETADVLRAVRARFTTVSKAGPGLPDSMTQAVLQHVHDDRLEAVPAQAGEVHE